MLLIPVNRMSGRNARIFGGVQVAANALPAIRCCLENMRLPDFHEWRACCAAVA